MGSTRSGHSAALAWLGGHPPDWGRSVVTIGSYDGVHRGHQLIIRHAVDRARELGVPSVVVTFDPHPSEVVRPGSHPPAARPAPPSRRADGEAGCRRGPHPALHHRVLTALARRLRGQGPGGQVARQGRRRGPELPLRPQGRRKRAVPGRAGQDLRLRRRGRRPLCERRRGRRRALLLHADPAADRRRRRRGGARDPRPSAPGRGRGVRGAQRGRELGFPTANVETLPHTAIPADGVYAGWLHVQGEAMPAAISVVRTRSSTAQSGPSRPTPSTGWASTCTGCTSPSTSWRSVRGQARFESLDALLEQMAEDVKRCRDLIAADDTD